MSYRDQYQLSTDPDFLGRISAVIAEQAKGYVDGEFPNNSLAREAINANASVTSQFSLLVATQPGITRDSADADLMAAVQYLWPIVAAKYSPVVSSAEPPA